MTTISKVDDVEATVKVVLEADVDGKLKMIGKIEPLAPQMIKAFSDLNGQILSDVTDSTSGDLKTPISGGSSSHSSRGGKSRKGRKSKKGGKSRKGRKSLRRK